MKRKISSFGHTFITAGGGLYPRKRIRNILDLAAVGFDQNSSVKSPSICNLLAFLELTRFERDIRTSGREIFVHENSLYRVTSMVELFQLSSGLVDCVSASLAAKSHYYGTRALLIRGHASESVTTFNLLRGRRWSGVTRPSR